MPSTACTTTRVLLKSLACTTALLACSLTGCTKQQTAIGVGLGAAMIVTGAIMTQSDDFGLVLIGFYTGVGGGSVVVGGSLIGGLIGPRESAPSRPRDASTAPSRPSDPDPEGLRCHPVTPASSFWTCGEGYACTEDFEGCEPAVGAPVRQR